MSELLLNVELNKDQSYQYQIREKLIEVICDNQIGDNPLPSSRKLANNLGVSRNTITLVYQSLIDEGYLISKERRGFYVNPYVVENHNGKARGAQKKGKIKSHAPKWINKIKRSSTGFTRLSKDPNWIKYPYAFVYGQVNPNDFPIEQWRDCNRWVQTKKGVKDWVEDFIDEDDKELIRQISQRILSARGVSVQSDEVLITLGTQNSLFMLSQLLIDKKTKVGVEDPGYIDFRNILHQVNAQIIPLVIDNEGLIVDKSLQACDYVFVTPSHQYPTSVTLSLERRKALLESAAQNDFLILEDDYESEVNFLSKPLPALKSIDQNGRVIYLGSLSKSLSPGLRIGYIAADKIIINELRALRRLNYRHPPSNNQRTTALFISQGYYTSYVRRMKHVYEQKWCLVSECLAKFLPMCRVTATPGSFCFWVQLPHDVDSEQLTQLASAQGIFIESGDNFFLSGTPRNSYLRLGFSAIPTEKIKPGLKLLGAILELAIADA